VNLDVHFKYKCILSTNCGKWNEIYLLPFFLLWQFKFVLPAISKIWPAFARWQPAISSPVTYRHWINGLHTFWAQSSDSNWMYQ
jgi:hypothetical protein